MPELLIRADADRRIGAGHVLRCLALAQAWQHEGGTVRFIGRWESGALRERVEASGATFTELERSHPHPMDGALVLSLLRHSTGVPRRNSDGNWLVTDGYHFDEAYHRSLRAAGYRLLVIDDLAHLTEYHADVVLNQNLHARGLRYRCSPDTVLLLGTSYLLLRPEFAAWGRWKREVADNARKVLVTLGGSDPDNVTLRVIQALDRMRRPGLHARILVGPANPHGNVLREAVHRASCRLEILCNVTDMPALMAWADVAVSGAGSTCWELAYMGLPGAILQLADNQGLVAESMSGAGAAVVLGEARAVHPELIAARLGRLLDDAGQRRRLAERCRALVDGAGAARVVRKMKEEREHIESRPDRHRATSPA